MITPKIQVSLIIILLLALAKISFSQETFTLKPVLAGQHPRILFTQAEADARALLVQQHMPAEWNTLVTQCNNIGYPSDPSILGQKQWWYFSRLGIGIAMTKDQTLINKGKTWLSTCYAEDWPFDAELTVGLDIAHKLAGFAILYDCMYNYLTVGERSNYEGLLQTAFVKFRTKGYDISDYWTNDYQNNHMHFRATASLYCAAILIDKYPALQSEADSVMTVWRRIAYMHPHDGSNHEGISYSNYSAQMLYPGIFAMKHCTGIDLIDTLHLRNTGYHYIYNVTPGLSSGFGFGDTGNSASAHGPDFLYFIAAYTNDPYIQYLVHRLKEDESGGFFLPQWHLLYDNPLLEQKAYTSFPLHRYFDDIGIAICRSSWNPDATSVAFKCGPMGGKLLNDTRKTEYSHFTDWVNVAHDDPDAGTFLLFSKGNFLTTGDGYEKVAKITSQHSTFIVDDLNQYGGGGGWSATQKTNKYAWQKDFSAVDERVVFSGDMKGVYPNMGKLTRTFVSHKAKYILIYDDASSTVSGRTFEWRLQTKGTLSPNGDKTYKVSNGSGNALVKILSPSEADWSVTTNKIGNILRARLTNQQNNNFLVLLWPDASNLNAVSETYNTAETAGVKVSLDGNNEYTLFQKTDNVSASAGNIIFNGSTLLLIENNVGNIVKNASLVNGKSLSFKSVSYFSSSDRINFGIESISADTGKVLYNFSPSSSTANSSSVNIELGGLSVNKKYYLIKDGAKTGTPFTTSNLGQVNITLDLSIACKYLASVDSVLINPLGIPVVAEDVFSSLKIYPNPASDMVNIAMNQPVNGDLIINIFRHDGKMVKVIRLQKNSDSFSTQVDLNGLMSGVYILKIQLGNYFTSRKILME